MAKFEGQPNDLVWGRRDYPVTRTQKATLDGLRYMMTGLPHSDHDDIPQGYFCSQNESNGDVVIGLHHHSVSVHRNGRLTANL
jgi:hypothetical protein